MNRAKRGARAITIAEIEQQFELASYWFGTKWCPAVDETERGYHIRIIKSHSFSGTNRSYNSYTYDYFELDEEGVVTAAPRGYASAFKPGRVVDIKDAVQRFADAPPNAMRIAL